MLAILNTFITEINNNVLISSIISVAINILSRVITIKLPDSTERIIRNAITQELLFFLICFLATKNLLLSIFITVLFIIVTQLLLNDESKYNILDYIPSSEFIEDELGLSDEDELFTNMKKTKTKSEKQKPDILLFNSF
jgi:hypothetical protein